MYTFTVYVSRLSLTSICARRATELTVPSRRDPLPFGGRMSEIVKWLETYSPAVVALMAVIASLIYFVKIITEKAITRQFDRYAKVIDLQLQRNSNFEERILTERFTLLRKIYSKIDGIFTDLTRRHEGIEVERLVTDGDIVSLTEVFELMGVNRYLLPQPLFLVLDRLARLALQYAHARDQLTLDAAKEAFETLREEFDRLMTKSFRLNEIGSLD